jgi:radical SAM protein with 4Fe4S-binding SPASM domain
MAMDGAPETAFPRHVAVETVSTCNARCVFCPHPLLEKNKDHQQMSEKTFEKIIEECAEYNELEMITLSFQNEPLTDPRLFERISYVRQKTQDKVKIVLVTNGALLRGRRLEQLLDNPPDILKISFNGLTQEEYESTMVGLRFKRTMSNIDTLVESLRGRDRPVVQINCVYTKEAEKRGPRAIKAFWAEKGVQLHIINVENRAGTMKDLQSAFSNKTWNLRTWCKRPEEQLSVWPTGDVALCCADWRKEVKLGNVNDMSLYEIWHGATISHYRQMLRSGRASDLDLCKDCMAAEIEFDGVTYKEFGKTAESL